MQFGKAEKQQRPEPFGAVPMGHTPKIGVVQLLPPRAERLHEKNSAFESRQRLPPVIEEDADANKRLKDTLAVVSQLVPKRHDENATPVADPQVKIVPNGPVRFSVLRSLEPT